MRNTKLAFVCVFCIFVSQAVGQSAGQLTASLDEDFFFVLNGTGEQIGGLELKSPLGGLIPSQDAAPFAFMLSNTAEQITYGNLGTSVKIDGAVKVQAGYNTAVADPDVTVTVGIGATPVEIPFTPGPCDICPTPILRAGVNSDLNLELRGVGQTISDITFRSASGSLRPAASAAPFAESVTNTANEVTLASPGTTVTLDGLVVLEAGWNDQLYTRDIEYEYSLVEDGQTEVVGPMEIGVRDYDFNFPNFFTLDVRVREDDRIVINGRGQPVTSLTLNSPQGSLIPSDDAGPFVGYGDNNTATQVDYLIDGSMVFDGEIVLPTIWDWRSPKNIRVTYDQLGDLPSRSFLISQARFPAVPESGKEPLLVTLDENNNFVITGSGQEIHGIEFVSPSGALRPSEEQTSAPFPLGLNNEPDNIALGVLGKVKIEGSFVMDFGITDPSLLDEVQINVGFSRVPTPNPIAEDCERCEDYPAVVLNEDRGIVLENFPSAVTELKFSSKFGGLEVIDSAPEGVNIISSTNNELVIGNEEGFTGADLLGLEAVWGASSDGAVFVSFALLEGGSFGPLPLDLGSLSSPVVPEPSSGMLLTLAGVAMLRCRRRRS